MTVKTQYKVEQEYTVSGENIAEACYKFHMALSALAIIGSMEPKLEDLTRHIASDILKGIYDIDEDLPDQVIENARATSISMVTEIGEMVENARKGDVN